MSKAKRKARRAKRQEKRAVKKATRVEKRAVKKEVRQENRAERKNNRQDRKQVRQENRAERKEERKEGRKGRNIIGKAVHSIGGGIKGAAQSTGEIAKDTVTTVRESAIGTAIENTVEAKLRQMSLSFWRSTNGTMASFPEQALPEVTSRPSIGICFSGGGSRSAVASFGQMRALTQMGLDKFIRYTSANSGGSWFSIPYTYLPDSISDAAFFGEYIALDNIVSLDQLRVNTRKSRYCLALTRSHVASNALLGGALDAVTKSRSAAENWSRAVGNVVLKPFGLYDAQRALGQHKMFTWSQATLNNILSSNKFLEQDDFHIVEKPRPFNITIGVAIEPHAYIRNAAHALAGRKLGLGANPNYSNMALMEMTPLYSGVTTSYDGIGGGYIESFGQDSKAPKKSVSGQTGKVKVRLGKIHNRFGLSDVVGISGAALAMVNDVVKTQAFTPQLQHWPLSQSNSLSRTINAIDGGYLETQAIIPLLKRQTKKIIACVNAEDAFSADGAMKPGIAHLFGDQSSIDQVTVMSFMGNHVLSNQNGELEALKKGLADNNKKLNVSFHKGRYQVLANRNYGTTPYTVEILWYFLDTSKPWSSLINQVLKTGSTKSGVAKSLTNNFPNYAVARLSLSEEEVSLLANFTHWGFKQMEPVLKTFFGERKRTCVRRPARSGQGTVSKAPEKRRTAAVKLRRATATSQLIRANKAQKRGGLRAK